jgi:tetratricopeptide (TPR) repeat protein
MAVATFASLSLDEAFAEAEPNDDARVRVPIRRELDVNSFGINAFRAGRADTPLVREHDETGPGADRHEELYFVASGSATFTVAGEEIDAPQGTFVFVRDPEAKRAAVAKEAGTTLIAVGGRPGQPWRMSVGEALTEFFPLHSAKDYEGAAAVAREVLEAYPGNGLALYNLACCESLLGQTDKALKHLAQALETAPSLIENAKTDEDFAPIRNEARFAELVA